MPSSRPRLILIADAPGALVELGGISLLERVLRVVQRLGFREAIILSNSPDVISADLQLRSPPRAEVSVHVRPYRAPAPGVGELLDAAGGVELLLVISAAYYHDPRLLRALVNEPAPSVLVDSDVPAPARALWENVEPNAFTAAIVAAESLRKCESRESLRDALMSDSIRRLDAAGVPAYLPNQRRTIRPVFFPTPAPAMKHIAERILHDTTQKGVLDLPALVHAPIESWIVARLCRTSITPNQVSGFTACIGIAVTVLFATGHLWAGTLLALCVGVLDGCDGKLARLKVETTPTGEWEHVVDYLVEQSWWTALAYHFRATEEVPRAGVMWLSLLTLDLLARAAKGWVKKRTGRTLDDVSRFDRMVRYVAARRNIYIWILAFALIFRAPARGYIAIYWCGILSALIHLFRAAQIRMQPDYALAPRKVSTGESQPARRAGK